MRDGLGVFWKSRDRRGKRRKEVGRVVVFRKIEKARSVVMAGLTNRCQEREQEKAGIKKQMAKAAGRKRKVLETSSPRW